MRPANGKNTGNPNKKFVFDLGLWITTNKKIIIDKDPEVFGGFLFPCPRWSPGLHCLARSRMPGSSGSASTSSRTPTRRRTAASARASAADISAGPC